MMTHFQPSPSNKPTVVSLWANIDILEVVAREMIVSIYLTLLPLNHDSMKKETFKHNTATKLLFLKTIKKKKNIF